MTKGQRAMAVAILNPFPEKRGRGNKSTTNGEFGVVQQRVSDARAVLKFSRELADAVMHGEKPLQAALAEARLSQGGVRNDRARLTKLRDERPDLAELVSTEAMSLTTSVLARFSSA